MTKLDKLKEILNTLRVLFTVASAFVITLGGTLGKMFISKTIDYIFWITFGLFEIFLLGAVILMIKIIKITKDIKEK